VESARHVLPVAFERLLARDLPAELLDVDQPCRDAPEATVWGCAADRAEALVNRAYRRRRILPVLALGALAAISAVYLLGGRVEAMPVPPPPSPEPAVPVAPATVTNSAPQGVPTLASATPPSSPSKGSKESSSGNVGLELLDALWKKCRAELNAEFHNQACEYRGGQFTCGGQPVGGKLGPGSRQYAATPSAPDNNFQTDGQ
jgi:hypothetical protein